MEMAIDTTLTDLTCESCGSHFSLVDDTRSTRSADTLTTLGRFELLERLGVGGFGTVWKARDTELDRPVAVKIPRQGDMSPEETEKFLREARAAAQLKHPNIVSVYEVGRDGDSVYIVSDFVRGADLADWLTEQQLTGREAAELCAKLAEALHHAHEQGVIHRDLKPANVMMDANGEPHLMDFGLARREVGELTMTIEGQVLGTPAYMSPEQAQGEAHTADRRSDVYSLGVILFQLLTGERPFRGSARMLLHQVISEEAPSPRKLNSNVHRDLETITLKCLEKDPTKRYQTSREMADELKRWLNKEPILARPTGIAARILKWCRRRPTSAALVILFLIFLILGPIIAVNQVQLRLRAERLQDRAEEETVRAISAAKEAEQSRLELQRQLYNSHMNIGFQAWHFGDNSKALSLLNTYVPQEGSEDIRRFEWDLLWSLCHPSAKKFDLTEASEEHGALRAMLVVPNEETVAIGTANGTILKFNTALKELVFATNVHDGPINRIACNPNQHLLATAGDDYNIALLDSNLGQRLYLLEGHLDRVTGVDFSPDGSTLASSSSDGTVRLWDCRSGQQLDSVELETELNTVQILTQLGNTLNSVRFSPDGTRLAVASFSRPGKVYIYDLKKRKIEKRYDFKARITDVDFSPNGKLLAVATYDGWNFQWIDLASHERTNPSANYHRNGLTAVRFSPDGQTVATSAKDRTIKIWNLHTKTCYSTLRAGSGPVYSLDFTNSGDSIVSLSEGNALQIWDRSDWTVLNESFDAIGAHDGKVSEICFAPNGERLASVGWDSTLRIWDLKTRRQVACYVAPAHLGNSKCVAWSSDGKLIASGWEDGRVCLHAPQSTLDDVTILEEHRFPVKSVSFSSDSKLLVSSDELEQVVVWDLQSRQQLHKEGGHYDRDGSVAFLPGQHVFALGRFKDIDFIQAIENDGKNVTLPDHIDYVFSLEISPQGKKLAAASWGGEIRLWQINDLNSHGWIASQDDPKQHLHEYVTLQGHTQVSSMCFSPDGAVLASGGRDQVIRFWDAEAGEQTGYLETQCPISDILFAPDGQTLAYAGEDHEIHLLNVKRNHLEDTATDSPGEEIKQVKGTNNSENITEPNLSDLRRKLGEVITVEFVVTQSGESPGWHYYNSMPNYLHPDCVTVTGPSKLFIPVLESLGMIRREVIGHRIRATGEIDRIGDRIIIIVSQDHQGIEIYDDSGNRLTPLKNIASGYPGKPLEQPVDD